MPARPNIRVRREFGNEPAELIEKITKVPPREIARQAAKLLFAQEVATRFANSFPGATFRGIRALSILEQGPLPDLKGTSEMRAELFGQAMIGMLRADKDEKSQLVSAVASGAIRSNIKLDFARQIVTRNQGLDQMFGRDQGKKTAFMAAQYSMLHELGMTTMAAPIATHSGAHLVEPSAVAGACWIDADARNPLSRLVHDRSSAAVGEIDELVKAYKSHVQPQSTLVFGEQVARSLPSSRSLHIPNDAYTAIRDVYNNDEPVISEIAIPYNRYEGAIVPTDMFFSLLGAGMKRFDAV